MTQSQIYSILLVLSVICLVNGETSVKLTGPQKNPDHPNKCWDESTKTAYTVGSHNPKDSCQRIHCYPDFRIKYTSCGTHSAGQGYTIEQDLSKNYPECCAKLVKVEKKPKHVDFIGSSEVRINKFRTKERSGFAERVPKEMKPAVTDEPTEVSPKTIKEAPKHSSKHTKA